MLSNNNTDSTSDSDASSGLTWQSYVGAGFVTLSLPFPKAFVAPGASTHSSIFSTLMSKTPLNNVKIRLPNGIRRLYTHTLNGSKRYAATWGRFVGRWGTRILGPLGTILLINDVGRYLFDDLPEVKQGSHATTCFVAGTKIIMSNGSTKNIENIVVGDKILSVEMGGMNIEEDIVVDIPDTLKTYKIIEAKFDNGTINKFSPAHPFWVKDKGWCVFDLKEAETELTFKVKQLQVGDILYYYNNGELLQTKLVSLLDTGLYVEMYNVEFVKKNHTFFANGILVHNKLEK